IVAVEATEDRELPAQAPDQLERRRYQVRNEAELMIAHELEPEFGLVLRRPEFFSGDEEQGDEVRAAIAREGDVAELVGFGECSLEHRAAGAEGLRPGIDVGREEHVSPQPETLEPPLLDEVEAEPGEAISRLVIAKVRAEHDAKPDESGRRAFA